MKRLPIYLMRLAVLVALLAIWQYLPEVHALSTRFHFLNPFFISSPEKVAHRIYLFAVRKPSNPMIWGYLGQTTLASFLGFGIGSVIGFAAGLLLSNSPRVSDVLTIFIMAGNSVPRIALVPVIILLAGTGLAAGVVSAVMVVFFLTFFSAFEGGRRVPSAVLANAKLLGASSLQIMLRFRMPYVSLWTFAVVPNALAFSLIAVVTTEILAGTGGVGTLLVTATSNLDAATTFAIVVYLSVTGVIMLQGAKYVKRRALSWAEEN
jgi:NitT/TauT family transport system permease protein